MAVRVGSVLVGLTVLVAGCSSEEAPATLPPLPSAIASPSAAGVAEAPEAARMRTPQGASQFARYYLNVVGASYEAADPTRLAALSEAACKGCNVLLGAVRRLQADMDRREGGLYTVQSAVTPELSGGTAIVTVDYTRTAGRVVDAAGATVLTAPAVPMATVVLNLMWTAPGWVVTSYEVVA